MPHPQADLLRQMPHPGEAKAVKCLKNARGGGGGDARLKLTEPLLREQTKRLIWLVDVVTVKVKRLSLISASYLFNASPRTPKI